MILVGRMGFALAVVLSSALAAADEQPATMDKQWPALPASHALSEEDVMVDHLSELGNMLGGHLDLLSHDMVALHVDGRGQRARLRVGGENIGHYLTFRI